MDTQKNPTALRFLRKVNFQAPSLPEKPFPGLRVLITMGENINHIFEYEGGEWNKDILYPECAVYITEEKAAYTYCKDSSNRFKWFKFAKAEDIAETIGRPRELEEIKHIFDESIGLEVKGRNLRLKLEETSIFKYTEENENGEIDLKIDSKTLIKNEENLLSVNPETYYTSNQVNKIVEKLTSEITFIKEELEQEKKQREYNDTRILVEYTDKISKSMMETSKILIDNMESIITELHSLRANEHVYADVFVIEESADLLSIEDPLLVEDHLYVEQLEKQSKLFKIEVNGMPLINGDQTFGDYTLFLRNDILYISFHEILTPGTIISITAIRKSAIFI
jgi:hypothetical protein